MENRNNGSFEALERDLAACYGLQEGGRVFRTVIPGILADFSKMIGKAPEGALVREEYRLEDGRGTICLTCRKSGGARKIEAEFRR